jgi:hypothetical protein
MAQESHVSAQREYLNTQIRSSSLCAGVAFGMHTYEDNLFHIQFPLWPEHPKELRYRKCLLLICESIASD